MAFAFRLTAIMFGLPLWIAADVCRYRSAAWKIAGFNKWFWLVTPLALAILSIGVLLQSWTLFGVALLLLADGLDGVYLARVRPFVKIGHGMHNRGAYRDRPLSKWLDKFSSTLLPGYRRRD